MKKLFAVVFVLVCGLSFAQDKPRLGIVPFTGGPDGDAETITTLFTYHGDFIEAFTPVPVTNAVRARVSGDDFQLLDWIDSDTGAELGRLMNADLVISGQIRRVGTQNLVVVSLVNVNTSVLLAGVCREYRRLDEIPAMLPEITRTFINASRKDTSALPRLAVALPLIAGETGGRQEAETLIHILTVELAGMGRYAVMPRLAVGRTVLEDMKAEVGDSTPLDGAKALGKAVNARFVLVTEARSVGAANMIAASIFDTESDSLVSGGYKNYYSMIDGCYLMSDLCRILAGVPLMPALPPLPARTDSSAIEKPPAPPLPVKTEPPVVIDAAEEKPAEEKPAGEKPAPVVSPPPPVNAVPPAPPPPVEKAVSAVPPPARETKRPQAVNSARLWTLGVSGGTSYTNPLLIGTIHGTVAPLDYSFVEIGCDAGFLYSDGSDYYSLYPFARLALFVPFPQKGGFYIGAGGGYTMSLYFSSGAAGDGGFALDAVAGFNLWNMLDVSYTVRTTFISITHKISAGYTFRF